MTIRATIFAAMALFLVVGCQDVPTAPEPFEETTQEQAADPSTPDDAIVLHHNGTEAGYVLVSNTEDELHFDFVLHETENAIYKVYLHVAPSAEELPRNQADNPIPGHFEHKFYDVDDSETTLSVELDEDYEVGDEVVIAAYASAALSGEEEALWAGEDRFRGEKKGGNWATHFDYVITEPESQADCEEDDGVWAYAVPVDRPGFENSSLLSGEEGAIITTSSKPVFVEGDSENGSYSFDGAYSFGEYGTLEIDSSDEANGVKLTVTASEGYYVHNVKYKNSDRTNPGGFENDGPYPQERPSVKEIALDEFKAQYLSVEAFFKLDGCE